MCKYCSDDSAKARSKAKKLRVLGEGREEGEDKGGSGRSNRRISRVPEVPC